MKRKAATAGPLSKKVCQETLNFEILGLDVDSYRVKPLGDAVSFEEAEAVDTIEFAIYFVKPILWSAAERCHLNIFYEGRLQLLNNHIFGRRLVPPGAPSSKVILQKDTLEYVVFETHQLKVSQNGLLVDALYLTIANNLTTVNTGDDGQLETQIDMKLGFLKDTFGSRFQSLHWFPPDIDPATHGIKIVPQHVPQRTPLWFKLRGELSGSKAYLFIGFFVPLPSEGPFDYRKKAVIPAKNKAKLRLGSISEDGGVILYLGAFPDCIFHERGWCPAPTGYPIGWGASPDGLIEDPTMTWEQVPEFIRDQYPTMQERHGLNITRGALEFKTTRGSLEMVAYYYPQVYMEMIALNVVWCDLVRFRPQRVFNKERQAWVRQDVANVYRIFRDKATERTLVKLWKHSHTNASKLQQTVQEPHYVMVREHFERMASVEEPTHRLSVVGDTSDKYDAHRRQLVEAAAVPAEHAPDEEQALLKRAGDLMIAIHKMDSKRQKTKFIGLLTDEISVCSELIKKTM